MLLNLSSFSVADDNALVPETWESDGNDEQNVDKVIFKESLSSQTESAILQEHRERDDDYISIIIENKLYTNFTQ